MIHLYNTLTKKVEEFKPIDASEVKMYTCGFTVYGHTHIGHLKKYIGDDLLKRTLKFNGYNVKHVQNVTDVGHLESDSDEGEDKLDKYAKKVGMTVYDVARMYEKEFYETLPQVNIILPDVIERAASDESIQKQIDYIGILIEKGYAYVTDKGVYFDVKKLPNYNPFSNQPLEDKINGSREDLVIDSEKHNHADFALWVFRKGIHENHAMHWDSPWGDGFPGWHIECTAISLSNLGNHFDIHTGGIDHIDIHHPNEIAQNYGITGEQSVNYWVHHSHLLVDGVKMSKSLGNVYGIKDILDHGYDPLVFRYFVLGTHYRKLINFKWEALDSAQSGYNKLMNYSHVFNEIDVKELENYSDETTTNILNQFKEAINDDLNIPKSLGIIHTELKSLTNNYQIGKILLEIDKVYGLNLTTKSNKEESIDLQMLPANIQDLVAKRDLARKNKEWEVSDTLRSEIESLGYKVVDSESKTILKK